MNKAFKVFVFSLTLLFGTQVSNAQGIIPPNVADSLTIGNPIDLIKTPLEYEGDRHMIPHVPGRHVSNLISYLDYSLYIYPTSEPQFATVVLRNEDDEEIFSSTIYLNGNIEVVNLPTNLQGEYTLLYYIGDSCYRGFILL